MTHGEIALLAKLAVINDPSSGPLCHTRPFACIDNFGVFGLQLTPSPLIPTQPGLLYLPLHSAERTSSVLLGVHIRNMSFKDSDEGSFTTLRNT